MFDKDVAAGWHNQLESGTTTSEFLLPIRSSDNICSVFEKIVDMMALPTSIAKIGLALNFPCDTQRLWYHKDFFLNKKKLLIF
jgi:hypothetical protein